MGFLIGTDEAGYGPNLGPLVVTATVWHVADADPEPVELYSRLAPLVECRPDCAADQIAIADSKRLFHPGAGLSRLERGVLAAIMVSTGELPLDWTRLWQLLCPEALDQMEAAPWYRRYTCRLPRDVPAQHLTGLADALRDVLDQRRVQLVAVRCSVLFPAAFNRLVDRCGSKGTVLSQLTLDLIVDIVSRLAAEAIFIVCDKHGGRDRYAGLLQPRFADRLVRVQCEGRAESLYELGSGDRPLRISFRAKGEAFLPAALASMTSKYMRELSMAAFNQFWQQQVPGLQATAGYPQDAQRFRRQIAAQQQRLGIDDDLLWRVR